MAVENQRCCLCGAKERLQRTTTTVAQEMMVVVVTNAAACVGDGLTIASIEEWKRCCLCR